MMDSNGVPACIVVLDSDHSRFLLVVEVENGREADFVASEEQMKNYMSRMSVPTGILVTPQRFRVFRHFYDSDSPEAISKIADLPTTAVIPTPLIGDGPWDLARLVQGWLERLQMHTEEIPREARSVLKENVLPVLYSGEIRAAGPRWQQ